MDIALKEISVSDLVADYSDDGEGGCGRLRRQAGHSTAVPT